MRALCLVAVDRAAHTLALLTHTHGVGKRLSIHKHTIFKGAVWQRCKHLESNWKKTSALIYDRKCVWLWVPGHLGQHSPGGVYELEQLSGGQGLLSHSTLPRWGEEEAASAGLKGEQYSVLCVWRGHAYLTGADVAGLVRGGKPLAIVIDTMVIGAAFTHCTTGAWGEERDSVLQLHRHLYLKKKSSNTHVLTGDLGGMTTLGGGAACVCAQGLSVHTCAAGAGTLGVPVGAFLILHTVQHTRYGETRGVTPIDELHLCVWLRVSVCECIVNLCISDSRDVGL